MMSLRDHFRAHALADRSPLSVAGCCAAASDRDEWVLTPGLVAHGGRHRRDRRNVHPTGSSLLRSRLNFLI